MAYVQNHELAEALLEAHANGGLTKQCYALFNNIIEQRINKLVKYNKDVAAPVIRSNCICKIETVWHAYRFDQDNVFAYFVSVIDNVIKQYFLCNDVTLVSIEAQEEFYNND